MNKPTVIEKFTDNGKHHHWVLVDENKYILWSEAHPLFILMDSLRKQNISQEKVIREFTTLSEKINKWLIAFDKTYGPCLAFALKKGYVIPGNDILQMEEQWAEIIQMVEEFFETNKSNY